MKALSYLMIRSFKNRILELKKKPAMLILYIIILMSFVFVVIVSMMPEDTIDTGVGDIRILYLIIVGFGALLVISNILAGLKNGSTLFDMADINQIFVSPISPTTILFYGLIKQVGKLLLTSIFIFYQIGNLKRMFDFGFKEILFLFITFVIATFFTQLIAMAIYTYSNGNSIRKEIVRIVSIVLGVIVLGFIYFNVDISGGEIINNILEITENKVFGYVPVIGWGVMLMKGVVDANIINIIIVLALFLITSIGLLIAMFSGNKDYYEDVLVSTEVNHEILKNIKDKNKKGINQNHINVNRNSNKKIKSKDKVSGINRGSGAWTIFYKQILEMKRTSKFVWIDHYILFASIIIAILCYHVKFEYLSYIILGGLMYVQFLFSIITGIQFEMSNHYIFLIPDASYKKVVTILLKPLLKGAIEGVIFFSIIGIMGREKIITLILLILVYIVSALFYQVLTIFYQRVFGAQPNMIAKLFSTTLIFLVVFVPIIALTVIVFISLPTEISYLATLPFIVLGLLISIMVVITCHKLFDKMEYLN